MTDNELPLFLSEVQVTVGILTIALVFSAVTLWLMVHDYRIDLQNHNRKKNRLADFIMREQYYVYLLFFLLIAGEMWTQASRQSQNYQSVKSIIYAEQGIQRFDHGTVGHRAY